MNIPEKWQLRFIEMTKLTASWSKDPSTQVGAVITEGKRIISMGFNGYPSGVEDVMDDRELKYLQVIHAEENAMLYAKRDLTGCSIFVTHHPCTNCAAKIIQVGIKEVYVPKPDPDYMSRWADKVEISMNMFKQAGVSVYEVEDCSD